jgi:DNA-binding IclR family transcriptional regulator
LRHIGSNERPLTLSTLVRELGIPKSSLLSLLRALEEEGFVENRGVTGYVLGLRTLELGCAYGRTAGPIRVVHPALVSLSRRLDMTAHFAIRDGQDVVYLDKEEPPGLYIRLASEVGGRLPVHLTAVGQAILSAGFPELELEPVAWELKGTSGFPHTPKELVDVLAVVRRRGYAVDEGETLLPVRCVAAAIIDSSGQASGAIGVSYLRHGGPSAKEVGPAVKQVAAEVSRRLGHDVGGEHLSAGHGGGRG